MTAAAQTERTPRATRRLKRGVRIAERLELLKPVADGGMGSVWSARNVTTGAEIAVKVLHREHDRDRDKHTAERFRHEAQLGAKLAHRNITRVFDLIEENEGEGGSLVLVMELLRGQTLRDYYKAKRRLECSQAVAIVVPILSALQHAHEHGVIHRDLKPSNIFLHVDPDGVVTPKLLDFGIAKAKDSTIETRTGDALGTPSYMSPEQVRAAELDARSDLFAVAIVLYEIITGENPFQGTTPSAALAQVLELEIDPHPSIDPRLWIEIRRALSKQAYERHGSARELAKALCAAVGESESSLAASLAHLDLAPLSAALEDDEANRDLEETPRGRSADEGVDDGATLKDKTIAATKRRGRSFVVFGASIAAALVVTAGVLLVRSSSSSSPGGSSTAKPEITTTTSTQTQTQVDEPTIDAGQLPESDQTSNDHDPRVERSTAPAPAKRPPRHSTAQPQQRPKPSTSPSTSASLARTPGF